MRTDCKARIQLHKFNDNGSFFGAMKKVLFNKWALKSLCGSITRELPEEEDACKTIELFDQFSSLRRDDPSFQFRVELDDTKRQFKSVLWMNTFR